MGIWNQFGMVVIVLAALCATLLWLKNRGVLTTSGLVPRASAKPRELKVVDKVTVTAHHTLVLVEVNETRLLVCLSPSGSATTVVKGHA